MIPYRMNPLGITLVETIPLTFIAESAGSTVTLNATGLPTVSGLHYRRGKSGLWIPYTIGTTITLANIGDSVQFWNSADRLSSGTSNYVQFVMSGSVQAFGNVMSLLNYSSECPYGCFIYLFRGCGSLTSPAEISARTLAGQCYQGMYYGSGIRTMPTLPAETLASQCYYEMFRECRSLIELAPIAASALATYCCSKMFYNCKSLSYSPTIKAVQSANNCYYEFMYGCSAVTSAQEIRLQDLSRECLYSAFNGCSGISQISVSFTSWLDGATNHWVNGVAASGTFIKPAALPEEYGENRIPTGWTVVNK